jgi:S1-C subfamily serine protease
MLVSERNRYAAVLAVVAVGILGVGYWLKPVPKPQSQRGEDVSVTRAELENLQQLVRRNSLRNLSTSFSRVAEDTISHVVAVQPLGVNGVLIPQNELVIAKSLDTPPRQLSVTSGTTSNLLRTPLWVPGLPFVTSRFDAAGSLSPATVSDSTPVLGGWVMIVANGIFGQALLSPGIYNGVAQDACGPYIGYRFLTTVPLNRSHLGGGLFDLTGALQGFVLPCEDGPAAIPISEVRRAIASVNSDSGSLLAKYGIRVATGSDGQTTLVTEVWDGWSAADAGFEPGDQLQSIDGQKIATSQDAVAALLRNPSTEHEVEIRRGSRSRTLDLVQTTIEDAAMQPALTTAPTAGVWVTDLAIGSSAAKAGIKDGDRVLLINGRPATEAIVQRTLAQFRVADPISVIVQQRGRRCLVVVRP